MEKFNIIGAIAEMSHQDIQLFPDWDDFILGVVDIQGKIRAIYDRSAIIHHVMQQDGFDRFGAMDYVDEIADLCRGRNQPLFMDNLEDGFRK